MTEYQPLFEGLNKSQTGKVLVEYLEEMVAKYCDVRNFPEMTNEVRKQLDIIIRQELIDRIKLVNHHKESKDSFA